MEGVPCKAFSGIFNARCCSSGSRTETISSATAALLLSLAINLIAENQSFDSTWHEKFRCNRHGRLMAVLCPTPDYTHRLVHDFLEIGIHAADSKLRMKIAYFSSA